jgi:hypothetical protein
MIFEFLLTKTAMRIKLSGFVNNAGAKIAFNWVNR